ncbi:MAG: EcsC family protein [Endomicrobiaceae bacterium]
MEQVLNQKLSNNVMTTMLNYAYEKSIDGFPGFSSAINLAEEFRSQNNDIESSIKSLVNWQITKSACTGFVAGLGGLITLPVTIPANITIIIMLQVRMVAAVAYLRGYDLNSEKVKTFILCSLLGKSACKVLTDMGIKVSKKISFKFIEKVPIAVIKKINQRVGFRLITKYGEKGIINLAKFVPIIGGFVGGVCDYISTKAVSVAAKKIFIPIYN